MMPMLREQWVQYLLGGVGIFLVGFVVGFINSRVVIPPERPDRVVLNAGSAELFKRIPLTDAGAIAEGWIDPFRCVATKDARPRRTPGRFFRLGPGSEMPPYLLLYTADGPLLGIYFFSEAEMPPPWEHDLDGLIEVENMNFEQWGLHLQVRDRFEACGPIRHLATG